MGAAISGTSRKRCPRMSLRSSGLLKTQIRHEIPALVLDHIRTFQPFQRHLGVLIAEGCGPFVIGLGRFVYACTLHADAGRLPCLIVVSALPMRSTMPP